MRRATLVRPPNEPKEGFVLSAPRGFGFVLAVILGMMLVPGCRPDDGPIGPSEAVSTPAPQFSSTSQVLPDQYIVVFKSSLPDPATDPPRSTTSGETPGRLWVRSAGISGAPSRSVLP